MAGGVVAQVIECLPSNHEAQFKTQYLKKKKKITIMEIHNPLKEGQKGRSWVQ
jgi:hypothetical protein